MGRRGPAPRPTRLTLLMGETRPSRVNRNEPVPTGFPIRPVGMSAKSRAVWRRILRDYGATGVLTGVDADALRIYCEAVVRYEISAVLLEASGPVIKGQKGELVKNPLHQVVRDNAELVRSFARELGFTPSARSSLTDIKDPSEGDELDRWKAAR